MAKKKDKKANKEKKKDKPKKSKKSKGVVLYLKLSSKEKNRVNNKYG